MTLYRLTWEIEIEAESPREAAEIAREWLLDPTAECVVFEVRDFDNQESSVLIDLLEEDDEKD